MRFITPHILKAMNRVPLRILLLTVFVMLGAMFAPTFGW